MYQPLFACPIPSRHGKKVFLCIASFPAKNTSACTLFSGAFCVVGLHAFTSDEVLLNCSWEIPYQLSWVLVSIGWKINNNKNPVIIKIPRPAQGRSASVLG